MMGCGMESLSDREKLVEQMLAPVDFRSLSDESVFGADGVLRIFTERFLSRALKEAPPLAAGTHPLFWSQILALHGIGLRGCDIQRSLQDKYGVKVHARIIEEVLSATTSAPR